jgi:hypothetical protein
MEYKVKPYTNVGPDFGSNSLTFQIVILKNSGRKHGFSKSFKTTVREVVR